MELTTILAMAGITFGGALMLYLIHIFLFSPKAGYVYCDEDGDDVTDIRINRHSIFLCVAELTALISVLMYKIKEMTIGKSIGLGFTAGIGVMITLALFDSIIDMIKKRGGGFSDGAVFVDCLINCCTLSVVLLKTGIL